jgi:hypothetical protein
MGIEAINCDLFISYNHFDTLFKAFMTLKLFFCTENVFHLSHSHLGKNR